MYSSRSIAGTICRLERHFRSDGPRYLSASSVKRAQGHELYSSVLPNLFYNEEQLEMQRSFKKLIDTKINPYVNEWEAAEQFPSHDIFKILGDGGFLGIHQPTEYGGLGLSYKHHAAILEEMGKIEAVGVTASIAIHTDVALPTLAKHGSDRLKKEFLQPSVTGEYVACVGASEPGAGSDVAGMTTKAVRRGDDLIINGEKVWISNGMKSNWGLVIANTSEGPPHKNKSLICVPMNLPGITRRKIRKIGVKCSDWAQISFEDVCVPASNIVGKEGKGFQYLMAQFQDERLSFAMYSLRYMESAINKTIEYTRERKTFGRSILDNQVVHFRLSELTTEVEALRALTYTGVDMHSRGEDVTIIASMAKLKCGRLVREVADSCLQYWGAMGYSDDSLISRYFRDFRGASIAGGSDEIILMILSRIICGVK